MSPYTKITSKWIKVLNIISKTIHYVKENVDTVRVVGDANCERIHKEKKRQRAKFLLTFIEWKGAWYGEIHQQQNAGALSFFYVIHMFVE